MTALIWASGRGHANVALELIRAGAKADEADKVGGYLKVIFANYENEFSE